MPKRCSCYQRGYPTGMISCDNEGCQKGYIADPRFGYELGNIFRLNTRCPKCKGTGFITCSQCNGRGEIEAVSDLEEREVTRRASTFYTNLQVASCLKAIPMTPPLGPSPYIHRGHDQAVRIVAWSPDGRRIASASWDTTQVWDSTTGEHPRIYPSHARALVWASNAAYIASESRKLLSVWDPNTGNTFYTDSYESHSDPIGVVALSPNDTGKYVAYNFDGDSRVYVWSAASRKQVARYNGHSSRIKALAWSPSGEYIASSDSTYSEGNIYMVEIWNVATAQTWISYWGHSNDILAVAWSPDGKRIASGGKDSTVQMWNAIDGRNVFTYCGHRSTINALSWLPDGSCIASAGDDKTIQVWRVS